MKRSQSFLSVLIMLLILPAVAHAQLLSSGVISPSRATDWTRAGFPGSTLPSASWTQCGPTIAAYSGAATTITNALNATGAGYTSCTAPYYIQLGAGTFTISSGQIRYPTTGHVALRGMGANSTFLVFTTAGAGCDVASAVICAVSSDTTNEQSPGAVYNWTSGYSQGSNQITLSGTAGINLNSTVIVLNQCDTGFSGSTCSGNAVDNGQMFVCSLAYSGGTGCGSNGADPGAGVNRSQLEFVTATAINSATGAVTISPTIAAPNYTSALSPQVWFFQPIIQAGLENLSIDGTNSNATSAIAFQNAYQGWVSGVRFVAVNTWNVEAFESMNMVVKDCYFFKTRSIDNYGVRWELSSFNLVQNNIFEQVLSPIVEDGSSTGNVAGYNYMVNEYNQTDSMHASFFSHSVNQYGLSEGNIGVQLTDDTNHGSSDMTTRFRNFLRGWESCSNGSCGPATTGPWSSTTTYSAGQVVTYNGQYWGSFGSGNINNTPGSGGWYVSQKDSNTVALAEMAYSRYANEIGNVLGTPGYHTSYQNVGNLSVMFVGIGPSGDPNDSIVGTTMLRWGNYDTVTAAVRWCGNASDTLWSATCSGTSEIPIGISLYSNSLPTLGDTGNGMGALPNSLYLSSKPSWMGSLPFPAIGPDVTGGDLGICGGTMNTIGQYAMLPASSSSQCGGQSLTPSAWGGHVNMNAAMNCAINAMGMTLDGTETSALAFDASVCYGGSSSSLAPNPPTNLAVSVVN